MAPYERLIGDAMAGERQLFTRQDAAELAWKIVEPILDDPAIPPFTMSGAGDRPKWQILLPRVAGSIRSDGGADTKPTRS